MRLSSLATAALLNFVGSALAFSSLAHRTLYSLPQVRINTILFSNLHDAWWTERRARNVPLDAQGMPVPAIATLELDRDSVVMVLREFVQSDYAMQIFTYSNIQSVTDYGEIRGMFEYVRVDNTTIEVKMKKAFDDRNTALLDRLSKYLRARIPSIAEIHAVHRDGLDIY